MPGEVEKRTRGRCVTLAEGKGRCRDNTGCVRISVYSSASGARQPCTLQLLVGRWQFCPPGTFGKVRGSDSCDDGGRGSVNNWRLVVEATLSLKLGE